MPFRANLRRAARAPTRPESVKTQQRRLSGDIILPIGETAPHHFVDEPESLEMEVGLSPDMVKTHLGAADAKLICLLNALRRLLLARSVYVKLEDMLSLVVASRPDPLFRNRVTNLINASPTDSKIGATKGSDNAKWREEMFAVMNDFLDALSERCWMFKLGGFFDYLCTCVEDDADTAITQSDLALVRLDVFAPICSHVESGRAIYSQCQICSTL